MKIEVKHEEDLFEYPFIGISSKFENNPNVIVLFTKPKEGVVLAIGFDEGHKVGEYATNFGMRYFTKLKEALTLRND